MAELEVRVLGAVSEDTGDVEMQVGDSADPIEVGETGADAPGEDEDETMQAEKPAPRTTFVDYLRSPIISLKIGTGPTSTNLSAHQALLTISPYFSSAIAPDSPSPKRTIDLESEDLDATSAVLEYLYTGEYFPHKLSSSLQTDPSIPSMDNTGDQLLKHAKVYTLAEKLGMPNLKTLAHSKIHLVNSNAVAELNYARYVYSHTQRGDDTIRKPVASFWGQRSHVLRHGTEGSFREMCLEFPEFAFDVLSFVLDAEEKREERKRRSTVGDEDGGKGPGSSRKRARG